MIGEIDFILSTLAPLQSSTVVAQLPSVVRGLLLPCMMCAFLLTFVARGSLLPYTTYVANCPCGKGLTDVPSLVAIVGKGFVIALFGKRLVVALLGKHCLLCVLGVLTLGDIHTVFGVLAVLPLGVFAPLVIVWCNMVVVASCK